MNQPMNGTQKPETGEVHSAKWQARFDFFDAHGAPNAPTFKPALKQLPFKQKVKINFNIIAFFFGPIYLFVLGLWKKNITLIAIMVVIFTGLEMAFSAMGIEYPRHIDAGLGFGFNALYGITTNYAYYLKEKRSELGWNPFKGMRW